MCPRLTFPLFADQSLRDILIGGKSGSTTSMTPLLLFSGEGGTETRFSWLSCSSLTCYSTIAREMLSNMFHSVSQIYPHFIPGLLTDPFSLWAEEVPGWRPASGPPWVPRPAAGLLRLLRLPAPPAARSVLQWHPACWTDQLPLPDHRLLHQPGLHVSGASWGVGHVSCSAAGGEAEVAADCDAGDGGHRDGGGGRLQSHKEAAKAHRTQCVSREGACSRWCAQENS